MVTAYLQLLSTRITTYILKFEGRNEETVEKYEKYNIKLYFKCSLCVDDTTQHRPTIGYIITF